MKKVIVEVTSDSIVVLDTNITPELKEEGTVRELIRAIQDLRKEKGLTIQDRVTLVVDAERSLTDLLTKNKNNIVSATLLKDIVFKEISGEEIDISEHKVKFNLE